MTTAAIYVRVSTDEQASEGTSLEVQEARCRAYCAAQEWDVQAVYSDPGLSGVLGLDGRDGLAALFRELRAGRAQVLVVAKLDRLGRKAAW